MQSVGRIRKRPVTSGFTLIEMVVVISIISIIGTVAMFSALGSAKIDAKRSQREGNCRTLGDASSRSRLYAGIKAGVPDINPGYIRNSAIINPGSPAPVSGSPEARADTEAAYNFYIAQGFIFNKDIDLDGVEFLVGAWYPLEYPAPVPAPTP